MKLMLVAIFFLASVLLPIASGKSPIVLINGITGARLEARNDKQITILGKNINLCYTNGNYETTWVGIRLPGCGQEELSLRYIDGEFVDNEDVMIRVPEGLDGLDFIANVPLLDIPAIDYMNTMIEYFKERGYNEENKPRNLEGAPYDWRLAGDQLQKRGYFYNLKNTIMELYGNNGNRRVTIVAHSMGGLVAHYFLTQFTNQQWRDKYIHAFIPLSGAWSGGALAMLPLISGKHIPGIMPKAALYEKLADFLVPIARTMQSINWLLPREDVFGDQVLIETPNRKYTASDYEQLFEDIGYEHGNKKLQNILTSVTPDFPPPNVPTFCFYGTGVETPEKFKYDRDLSEDGATIPSITFGKGDGTVNQVSSEVCLQWRSMDKYKFMSMPFNGVTHLNMVMNEQVLEAIGLVVEADYNKRLLN